MKSLHKAWLVESASKERQNGRHRHILLLPGFFVLTVLLLGASLKESDLSVANVLAGEVRQLESGMQLLPDGAFFTEKEDSILLERGSVLARAQGVFRVDVSKTASVAGWNGGAAVYASSTSVTVVALTTPAVLRSSQATLLVPVGMQAKVPMAALTLTGASTLSLLQAVALHPLPDSFYESQLRRIDAFPEIRTASSPDDILNGRIAAMATVEIEELLHAVRTSSHEAPGLIRLHADTLAEDQSLLATLLGLSETDTLRSVLLPLVADPDLRLLLAAHPETRNQGMLAFEGSPADVQAFFLTFVLIDTLPEALPEWISNRIVARVPAAIAQSHDSLQAFRTYLDGMQIVAEEAREKGYVDRLRRYRTLTEDLASTYRSTLSDEDRERITAILEDEQVTESAVSSVPVQQPLAAERKEQLSQEVRAYFLGKNAMLTKDSSFDARFETEVLVRQIVLATAQGDQLFSFTFDPVSRMIGAIERNGERFTNPVSEEAFFEWISK